MDRVILHCDCNSYFASVECIDHPELRRVPMAVCGDPESRHGIILAKNELAKKCGVQTAETIWQAKRKCPNLVLVPPSRGKYGYYCEKINALYAEYTDQVERFSIDESWLDVTGSAALFGDGRTIADELRRRVREEFELTISAGVSFNKVFAKLGSDYKKPDATTCVTRENYKELLFPLPVRDMLFVGPTAAQALNRAMIFTIGDLANASVERLTGILGRGGETLHAYANGLDTSPVRHIGETDPARSISNSITFRRDLLGEEDIKTGLMMLAESVGARVRHEHVKARTVQVQIKDTNLRVISRQTTLHEATDLTRDIYRTALALVLKSWRMDQPIRLLSLGVVNFEDGEAPVQLSLFDAPGESRKERGEKLQSAIDDIRQRFGRNSIASARLLDKEEDDIT
ncbi:MAG: DNA polymerase IV [Clostridia bacterium]|nr:DNA polymerase IV [Clostridia bacterium]